MKMKPRYIQHERKCELQFSICSLVRDAEKYQGLVDSFEACGFDTSNSEFIAADNRDQNRYDGYSWVSRALAEAKGRYVVFCHEDVRLIEKGYDELVTVLDELSHSHPDWALAGPVGSRANILDVKKKNVAGTWRNGLGVERRRGNTFPVQAQSLDECFIIMQSARPVLASRDLGGFHFYGSDLCLQAELLGNSAYIIDFMFEHLGLGTYDQSFADDLSALQSKYGAIFPDRKLYTTTGIHLLHSSV